MGYDRNYLSWALAYLICGMSLGIVMAESHNPVQDVSLANIIPVGFVLSLVYGVTHKLWLVLPHPFNPLPSILQVMLHIHHAGALTMFTALLLVYGEVFLDEQIDPALAFTYITVLIGTQAMLYMVTSTPAEET